MSHWLAATSPCEAAVTTHDAYPAGIELDAATGAWSVTDPSEPLWVESNWPAEMYTTLYPHGAPSTAESVALLLTGVLTSLLTVAVVHCSHLRYKEAYKRL